MFSLPLFASASDRQFVESTPKARSITVSRTRPFADVRDLIAPAAAFRAEDPRATVRGTPCRVPRPSPPPTAIPTSLSRIAKAHPDHRLGGFRAWLVPNRTAAMNLLMTSS